MGGSRFPASSLGTSAGRGWGTAGFVFAWKVTGRVSAWMLCVRGEDAAREQLHSGDPTCGRWLTWGCQRTEKKETKRKERGGCEPLESADPPALG